ncbi:MAG: biotin/lipoyl-binding protein, partial [Candidatus Taylorbacteria bacterium]
MHKKIHSFFKGILGYATQHKIISSMIILVACIVGYYTYQHFKPVPPPQYVLSMVRSGSIVQTVTGSGQVTASNQTDIKSQVSGSITAIKVSVGQHVHAGDLLATIDSTSALLDLQNAQLALAKLTQPAKETDISNSTNNLTASYSDGFNTVSNAFLDLPTTMNGMKDILTGPTGFMTDSRVSYLSPTAQQYRNTAQVAYYKAVNQYVTVLDEYRGLSRTSATSSIENLISDTYDLLRNVAVALQDIQGTFTFIVTNQPEYYAKDATTAGSNIHTWSTTITGDVSSVLSARNSISSNKNSLSTLITGADTLDIQSQQLALEQKKQTYDNYFIRAPFDGIVGRIPVNVYDQASGSSVIATIVGDQKVSTISLNEVDAAKVAVG